jgi:hypothetical protein
MGLCVRLTSWFLSQALKNILIIRPSTLAEMVEDMNELKEDICKQKGFYKNVKLLVFDSVPMAIYPAIEEQTTSNKELAF